MSIDDQSLAARLDASEARERDLQTLIVVLMLRLGKQDEIEIGDEELEGLLHTRIAVFRNPSTMSTRIMRIS